jgi:nitrite reductase/ring-hydroxylating ferredoxin subunit
MMAMSVLQRPNAPAVGTEICRLDDIDEVGARGFSFGEGPESFDFFVVRHDGGIEGYINDCPHTGGPLDWKPDQFLNINKSLILCATPGALFRIEDGACIAGPCPGARLTPVPLELSDGAIVVGQGDG